MIFSLLPVAVDVGGVYEVHPRIDRGVKRGGRIALVDIPPRPANRPGAESNL